MGTCKVKSFKMSYQDWNVSWPGIIFKSTTIRLPVNFELELDEGCTKADCEIGQKKRGRVEMYGSVSEEFTSWTWDGAIGNPHWWDGDKWNGGKGSWSLFGEKASFADEPGFNSVELKAYPLYWGGVARAGHFEFETVVIDKDSQTVVQSLKWGLLINVLSPQRGGITITQSCTDEAEIGRF
jgi:hypothetical protein